jgi:hypothetical protein
MFWEIISSSDFLINVVGVGIAAFAASFVLYVISEKRRNDEEKTTHLKAIKTEAIKMLSNLQDSVNLFCELYETKDFNVGGGIEERIFLEYDLNAILLANEYCKRKGLKYKFKLQNTLAFNLIDSTVAIRRIKDIITDTNRKIEESYQKDTNTKENKVPLRDILKKIQLLQAKEKEGTKITPQEEKELWEETNKLREKVINPEYQALKDILSYMINNNKPVVLRYIKTTGSLFFMLLDIIEFLDDKDTLRKEVKSTNFYKKYERVNLETSTK